jgi:hypothetical protein
MREPRVFLVGLALAVLSGATAAPAGAQVIAGRGFGESYVSFQDVNGNGVLDCLEPVTLRVAYFDPASDTATGSITGRMVAPFAGAGGLSFLPGSVEIDRLFSVGDCVATIVTGNDPSDVEASVDFACGPPRPASGQGAPGGNVVAFLYRAAFSSSQPSFTAVMHGTTSDGLDAAPQLQVSGNIGAVCTTSGGAPNVAVAKTAAGTGVPGSTLLYAIAATDQSGLGLGGLQLTDEIPANTVFDAAASSPGWVCTPASSGGGGPPGAPMPVMAPRACGSVETPPALAVDTTLAAAVVGHGAPALPGDRIHYTLTVPNPTAGTLKALTAAASLDVYTVLAAGSVTSTQGVVTTGNGAGDATVAVALGDLAAGGNATVEWDVTVAAQLPPGITQVAAQVETTGSNIPPDESGPPPPPSTPGPTATPVAAGGQPPPRPQAIPTLDTWGLGAMTVLLGGMAAAALRRRRVR